jgi:hypothetical protein
MTVKKKHRACFSILIDFLARPYPGEATMSSLPVMAQADVRFL